MWRFGSILLFIALVSLRIELNSETIPSNIPEGFLPPLGGESNVTQRVVLSTDSESFTSGSFRLQRSAGLDPFHWTEIPIALQDGPLFEADAPFDLGIYRLKSTAATDSHLALSIREIKRSTNRTITFPFLPGWEHYLQAREAATDPWRNVPSHPLTSGFLRVPLSLLHQPLRILAKPPVQREEYEAIFLGGQSNALLSDNFYYPDKDTNVVFIDHELRFRNPARFYDGLKNYPWAYCFANGAASALNAHTGRKYLIAGVAVGGTAMVQWMPRANRYDRSTLFGQANFRRLAAAPHPVSAIWYYGHESSTGYPYVTNYINEWKNLIAEFQKEVGQVPVIFAQLAKSTDSWQQRCIFAGAEQQRLSEDGQPQGTPGHHMVVTFDLPLGDGLHLSGEANRILGFRFARAMRQHVYREPIDGTGPRLVSLFHPDGNPFVIRVTFTQAINEPVNAYDDQFRVTDMDGDIEIIEYSRTPDHLSIDLALRRPPVGPAQLSYGEPVATADLKYLAHVVRNAEGLPAPAFGPLEVP